MKSEYKSTIPKSTSSAIDNPCAGLGDAGTAVRRQFISRLLDELNEVLKVLLFGTILAWLIISYCQRTPTKFPTPTQSQTCTYANYNINLDGWTEGPAQIPCISPNYGLKLATTPGSSGGAWSFLMLVDGPLVKNESNPFVVVQLRTWRACYFQEWMLEMNVDGRSQVQAHADAKADRDGQALALAVGQAVAQAVVHARVDNFYCNINGTDHKFVLKGL